MSSSGKKKTTMAKLTRESRLRQRRMEKQAKKDARKNAPPEDPGMIGDPLDAGVIGDAENAGLIGDQLEPADGESVLAVAEQAPALEPVAQDAADA